MVSGFVLSAAAGYWLMKGGGSVEERKRRFIAFSSFVSLLASGRFQHVEVGDHEWIAIDRNSPTVETVAYSSPELLRAFKSQLRAAAADSAKGRFSIDSLPPSEQSVLAKVVTFALPLVYVASGRPLHNCSLARSYALTSYYFVLRMMKPNTTVS